MEVHQLFEALFRWLHVLAGIIWIGMLYFFNWVNGPFAATLDGDAKKKVVPELMPRALFWFRWGAAWTWVTGVLLLMHVFYHGGLLFAPDRGWGIAASVMVAVTFLAPFLYDVLHKTGLGKNPKKFATLAFVLIAIVIALMGRAGFGYRGLNIHLGALFGTIMAFNVWFRIWPAQRKIITAVKEGNAPDAALVSLAGARSRHNVYMSVPLVWAMINAHTVVVAGAGSFLHDLFVSVSSVLGLSAPTATPGIGAYRVTQAGLFEHDPWLHGLEDGLAFLVVILIGWHVVWQLYKKAPKVKGF